MQVEMMAQIELETDALDADTLEQYITESHTCNGWSFNYIENVNEDAVVKDVWIEGEDAHCVVYDPDLDCIIDPMLGQFSGLPEGGAWDGEDHPYAADYEDVHEWTDRDEFETHYSQHPNGPFIV